MNKAYYILLFWCLPLFLGAQTATEEALDKACTCFGTVDFEEVPFNYLEQVTDSCLQEALYTNLTGVLKENNTNIDDANGLFKVAQLIQAHLLEHCEGFQLFSKRLAARRVEEVKAKNFSTTGLLYHLNLDGRFPVFTILTEDNQTVDIYWIREFDGSARFFDDGFENFENTIVEVVWREEIEIYDPVKQRYPFYKEVLLIEEVKTIDKKERKAWVKEYERRLKKVKGRRKNKN